MPLHDGFWLHDDQAADPPRPAGAQCDPEAAVRLVEWWTWPLLLQRGDLLTKSQVFEDKGRASAADGSQAR
jgi:hypothetical protein